MTVSAECVIASSGCTWALAVLFLLPDLASIPVFLWYLTLGVFGGMFCRGSASTAMKVFVIPPIILSVTYWMFTVKRMELELLAVVTGFFSGVTLFSSFKSMQSRGILRRVVAIYIVTVIFMTIAQTFHLSRIWRNVTIEPDIKRRTEISKSIASFISPGLDGANSSSSPQGGECINCVLSRVVSFNRRLETYVFGQDGVILFSGVPPVFWSLYATVARQAFAAVSETTLPVMLNRVPSLTIGEQYSPAVVIRQSFAGETVVLLTVFESRFSDLLLPFLTIRQHSWGSRRMAMIC